MHVQMLTDLLAAAREDNLRLSQQVVQIQKQHSSDAIDAQEAQEDLANQVWLAQMPARQPRGISSSLLLCMHHSQQAVGNCRCTLASMPHSPATPASSEQHQWHE